MDDDFLSNWTKWTHNLVLREGLKLLSKGNLTFKNQYETFVVLRSVRTLRRFLECSSYAIANENMAGSCANEKPNFAVPFESDHDGSKTLDFYLSILEVFTNPTIFETKINNSSLFGVRICFYEILLLFYLGVSDEVIQDLPASESHKYCKLIIEYLKLDENAICNEEKKLYYITNKI